MVDLAFLQLLLYSHTCIRFFSKRLDTVPCAGQQDPLVQPFEIKQSASTNPKLPASPLVSPARSANTSLLPMSTICLCSGEIVCAIFGSACVWISHGVRLFLNYLYEGLRFHPCCYKWHYLVFFMVE